MSKAAPDSLKSVSAAQDSTEEPAKRIIGLLEGMLANLEERDSAQATEG